MPCAPNPKLAPANRLYVPFSGFPSRKKKKRSEFVAAVHGHNVKTHEKKKKFTISCYVLLELILLIASALGRGLSRIDPFVFQMSLIFKFGDDAEKMQPAEKISFGNWPRLHP